jgi:hypothetical protein
MTSHPLSSLINAFCDIFLSHCDKSDDFLYFYDSPNTIKVEPIDKSRQTLIFTYNSRDDWKVSTVKCANREDKAIQDLRKELTAQQTKMINYRRSQNK